jgi:hypothetical protein
MTITELIKQLEAMKEEHGDVSLVCERRSMEYESMLDKGYDDDAVLEAGFSITVRGDLEVGSLNAGEGKRELYLSVKDGTAEPVIPAEWAGLKGT